MNFTHYQTVFEVPDIDGRGVLITVTLRRTNGSITYDEIAPKAVYYEANLGRGIVSVVKIEYTYPTIEEAMNLITRDFRESGAQIIEIQRHPKIPYIWWSDVVPRNQRY